MVLNAIGFCAGNLKKSKSLTCVPAYNANKDALSTALLDGMLLSGSNLSVGNPSNLAANFTNTTIHTLADIALDFQHNILISPLVVGGICFLLGSLSLLFVKLN